MSSLLSCYDAPTGAGPGVRYTVVVLWRRLRTGKRGARAARLRAFRCMRLPAGDAYELGGAGHDPQVKRSEWKGVTAQAEAG